MLCQRRRHIKLTIKLGSEINGGEDVLVAYRWHAILSLSFSTDLLHLRCILQRDN